MFIALLLAASEDHFTQVLNNNKVDRNYWKGANAFHLYHQVAPSDDCHLVMIQVLQREPLTEALNIF